MTKALKVFATDVARARGIDAPIMGSTKAEVFHRAMELSVREDWAYIPTVSERLLRAKLLLEEVLETFAAMGIGLEIMGAIYGKDQVRGFDEITVAHIEGSRYDPIETADGLADIKVVANGTALVFGIPMDIVDDEVFYSNMTKLDENGRPIVNKCKHWESDEVELPVDAAAGSAEMTREFCHDQMRGKEVCSHPTHWTDPTKPIGKILKPVGYTPANIAGLYEAHIASDAFVGAKHEGE